MTITASASAKIILFGEHAVVYARPAVAVPFASLRVEVTAVPAEQFHIVAHNLQGRIIGLHEADNPLIAFTTRFCHLASVPVPSYRVEIQSHIPIASGLGSGAAISTALGRALMQMTKITLSNDDLNALVYETEKSYHGTPSGIDNTVIVYETPIRFLRQQPIQLIKAFAPFMLVVADTGIVAPTYESVGDVRKLYDADPVHYSAIFDRIGIIADEGLRAMQAGNNTALGQAMTENHTLLQGLTVSSPELDNLVETALKAGALGAKLSGGGRGGNMIALVTPQTAHIVRDALLQAGAVRVYLTQVTP
jgi:mevalonate kinase